MLNFPCGFGREMHHDASRKSQVQFTNPEAARQLLRTGPFNGLRTSVRALGDYATVNKDAAGGKDGPTLANNFFRALEAFDNVLNDAIKYVPPHLASCSCCKFSCCGIVMSVMMAGPWQPPCKLWHIN